MPERGFQRNTPQRKVILEELQKAASHPTAAELYEIVRRRLPRISLGTVYRNLELLSESGLIRKLSMGSAEARFDGDLEDYKRWTETRRPREAASQPRQEKPRRQGAPRPNRKALQSKQNKLETALTRAQAELAEVNRQLADPATYASPDRDELGKLNAAHATLQAKVEELEESWLELETAMGAAISVFPGARAIRVPTHRFAPVKTTSDLMRIWSDAYVLSDDHRIVPAAGGYAEDLVIDLDPAFYKRIDDFVERLPHGAPSLLRCRRLTVRGDFYFGKGVSISGEVDLVNQDHTPRRIADGEELR